MESVDTTLKGFLSDLITGIHLETVSKKKSANDYKDIPEDNFDRFLGSEEYEKLRIASITLLEMHARDHQYWRKTHNVRGLKFFKSSSDLE